MKEKKVTKEYVEAQISQLENEINDIISELTNLTEEISKAKEACPVDEWQLRNLVKELGYTSEAVGNYKAALENWDDEEVRASYIRQVIIAIGNIPGILEDDEQVEANCRNFCEGFLAGWKRLGMRFRKQTSAEDILKEAILTEGEISKSKNKVIV